MRARGCRFQLPSDEGPEPENFVKTTNPSTVRLYLLSTIYTSIPLLVAAADLSHNKPLLRMMKITSCVAQVERLRLSYLLLMMVNKAKQARGKFILLVKRGDSVI